MGLSKDWREFLELLNSRGVDYVIVGAHSLVSWVPTLHERNHVANFFHAVIPDEVKDLTQTD
jgi:hypothetical protein